MILRWDGNIFFQGTIANDVFPMFFHLSTITIEWNGWRQPLETMVFRSLLGQAAIGNNGF